MRDIKFRFWSKTLNKWKNPDDHKFGILMTENGFEYSTGWDGLDNPRFGTEDDEGYERLTQQEYEDIQNSFVACQFTGLPDKNGKDIYEGDKLKSHFGHIYTVLWHEDGWKYKSDTEETGCPLYAKTAANMEVVGNVHEQDKNTNQ